MEIENRVVTGKSQETHERMEKIVQELLELLGEVPLERSVREGGDTGAPVVLAQPSNAASLAFQKAAGLLIQQFPHPSPLPGGEGISRNEVQGIFPSPSGRGLGEGNQGISQ